LRSSRYNANRLAGVSKGMSKISQGQKMLVIISLWKTFYWKPGVEVFSDGVLGMLITTWVLELNGLHSSSPFSPEPLLFKILS
jgi:hypothetical protein